MKNRSLKGKRPPHTAGPPGTRPPDHGIYRTQRLTREQINKSWEERIRIRKERSRQEALMNTRRDISPVETKESLNSREKRDLARMTLFNRTKHHAMEQDAIKRSGISMGDAQFEVDQVIAFSNNDNNPLLTVTWPATTIPIEGARIDVEKITKDLESQSKESQEAFAAYKETYAKNLQKLDEWDANNQI